MRLSHQRLSATMARELEEEVDAAVALVQLRLLKDCALHEARAFSTTLRECLLERVQGHCYNDPRIGRAFRCLRSHRGKHDHVLVAAACLSNTRHILQRLPHTFCLWIDPGCVALRLLDDGRVEERQIGNTRFAIIESASSDDDLSGEELDDSHLVDELMLPNRSATTDDITTVPSTAFSTTTAAPTGITTSPSNFSITSSSFSPTVPHGTVSLPPPKPPLDTAAATKAARAAAQAALAEAQRVKQQMAKAVRRQSPKPRGRRSRRRRHGDGSWIGPPGYPMGMPWAGPVGPEQLLAMNAINSFMQQAC
jgi:hypothetical protein